MAIARFGVRVAPVPRAAAGIVARCAGALLLGCGTDLTLYAAAPGDGGPPTDCGTCADLRLECGAVVNRCGELLECGGCGGEGSCGASAPGRCGRPEDDCPTAPGEARLLATGPGFRAWPTALATTETELVWTTAHPTLSSPGPSELFRVAKCGGPVELLADLGNGDDLMGGQTVAVDDAFYWAVNSRGREGTRSARVPREGGGGEDVVAFAEGVSGPCAIAVDGARDRVIVAGCRGDPELAAVPRDGGDVVRLAPEASPGRRRVVVDGDRAFWSSREPSGIQVLDLADPGATPRTLVAEPATPRDLAVHRGVVYWLRPTDAGTDDEGAVLLRRAPDGPVETMVTLAGPHRSLSAYAGHVYLVDDAGPFRVDVETSAVERLPGPGGRYVLAEPDGIYVARPQPGGESTHQLWRVHRPRQLAERPR